MVALMHDDGVDDAADLGLPLGLTQLDEWTPMQEQHVVVQEARAAGMAMDRCRLGGLFMDAAGFTKQESFEGLFVNDVATRRRSLVCLFRKQEVCQCGCRGFCTWYPVMEYLRHDFNQLADGIWATMRYDRMPFAPGSRQLARAGKRIGIRMALTEIRADWPGFAAPMGFRLSSHATCPCPVCTITLADLEQVNGITLDEGPWDDFSNVDYQAGINRCLIKVQIVSDADRASIMASPLEFDKSLLSKGGRLGRILNNDVVLAHGPNAGFKLLRYDRLHPSPDLLDVGGFNNRTARPVPFELWLWRFDGAPGASRLLHYAPLMGVRGVGMESWAIDILHTWHLGPLSRLIAMMIWFLLLSDCFGVTLPWMHHEDTIQLQLSRLRGALRAHYRDQRRNDPDWSTRASQVWTLTVKMLGKQEDPVMKTKAAETKELLGFVINLFEQYRAQLVQYDAIRFKFLFASAQAAAEVSSIMAASGRIMSLDDQQKMLASYTRHVAMYMRAGGNFVPKHHLFFHCIQRIQVLGNPKYYSTYRDESLNGVVVKLARSSHRLVFMESVHDRFRWLGAMDLCTQMF